MAQAPKGIDIRQTSTGILIDGFFQDASGAIATSGTTTAKLYEVQSDGTLKSFDFNDNTFKTTSLTTETMSLTHRQGNNSTTNTGYWSGIVSTLTGFTVGGVYLALVNSTGASPTDQMRKFQFGSAEGDFFIESGTVTSGFSSSLGLRAGASSTNDYYKDQVVFLSAGTGAGQTNRVTAYNGTTKVATVETTWVTQPDNTSIYQILGRIG